MIGVTTKLCGTGTRGGESDVQTEILRVSGGEILEVERCRVRGGR